MKRYILYLALTLAAVPLFAQNGTVRTDIFGDLEYRSNVSDYTAALKKDIFDNLTFTDSRRNKIVFEKKYLELEYPRVQDNERAKDDFFRFLIRNYRSDTGYEECYKVDIFGSVVIEDNRGNKTETGTDIFGNRTYREQNNGRDMSLARDLRGTLQYRSGSDTASLGTDTFGKWRYEDSAGNRFEFGQTAWGRLIRRFGNDEKVFFFLMDQFLWN